MQAQIYLALAGRLVTTIDPRGRRKGETAFSFSFIVYRESSPGLQFPQRLYDPGCHFPDCRKVLSCTVAVANIIM